jgi:branched-chain amino acid transport system substrate-binding protein
MEQILDSGADAFLVTWAGGGFVPMMQAATDLGVFDEVAWVPALSTTWSCLPSSPMPSAIPAASSTITLLADNEINDWLVAKTMENDGVPPDLFDADAMNAALLLGQCLCALPAATPAPRRSSRPWKAWSLKGRRAHLYSPEDHVAIQDMYIVTLPMWTTRSSVSLTTW